MRHDVYLPLPVKVMTLDLDRPLAAIEGTEGFGSLRVLVRYRRVPLNWLTIERPPARIEVAAIEALLLEQTPYGLHAAAIRQNMGESPSGPLPPMSVIVCTRDRTSSLDRCLESIKALDYPSYEVIVVDNAPSTDETASLVARDAGSWPVRYVREDRPGLDWARNRGIAEARFNIIAFTDDDVRVDPSWLMGLAHAFLDSDATLVTGLVAPAELDTHAQIMFEAGYGGMGKGLWPVRWHRDSLSWILAAHHIGVGANMAFRRSLFDGVGLFDTALDVGTPAHGGGDLDMFHRVLVSGAVVRYEPRALVWHSHRREWSALRRQLHDNGRAFGAYLIACAVRGTASIPRTIRYSVTVWVAWFVGRIVRRFARREVLPFDLQFQEIWGAATAPWAYLAARRSDRRLRAQFSDAVTRSRDPVSEPG